MTMNGIADDLFAATLSAKLRTQNEMRTECHPRKQKATSVDMAFVVRFGNRYDLASVDQLAL
ncbi:hypothetical protein RISK_006164 [Rhodopirellula islandica]|uniref:Uncharacterized protein n=1 Tax=Rhodopirellula islandica TaxID=595434 RepID=A0A0J1B590_RHOIS|nr:hypothetical protein RISK_006164 [Rhodopirellula islandica]